MNSFTQRWEKLLSQNRLSSIQSTQHDTRNEFDKDYDRIIFCSSFRRLGKKTQVHPLSDNDNIHTRLTHSIEVSSAGRSLGQMAGQFLKSKKHLPKAIEPQDIAGIVQAACLAHDIGNPPFGHAGEFAIRHWFLENMDKICIQSPHEKNDFSSFDGNAQGFRLVTHLENSRDCGGLKLTYATLGTLVKYPWFSHDDRAKPRGKFNFYLSEKKIAQTVFSALELYDDKNDQFLRHPLSYLMEAADDICYTILDIEDGFELDLIRYHEAEDIFIALAGQEYNPYSIEKNWSQRRKIYYLRSRAIKNLIFKVMQIFCEEYDDIMQSKFHSDLISRINGSEGDGITEAKKLTQKIFFYKNVKYN